MFMENLNLGVLASLTIDTILLGNDSPCPFCDTIIKLSNMFTHRVKWRTCNCQHCRFGNKFSFPLSPALGSILLTLFIDVFK